MFRIWDPAASSPLSNVAKHPAKSTVCLLLQPHCVCPAGEVVGSLSILATFILSALQLYITAKAHGNSIFRRRSSSKCPKRVQLAQSVLLVVILAFWTAAASVFQIFGQRANNAGYPKETQRAVVAACAWSSVALLSMLVVWESFLRAQGYSFGSSSSGRSSSSRVPIIQLQQQPVIPGYPAVPFTAPPAAAVPYAVPTAAAGVQQQYTLQGPQQQQQQWTGPGGVVVGIPLIPIPASAAPQQPPPLLPAARLAGMGPSSVQMAVLSGGHQLGGLRTQIPRRITYPVLQTPPAAAAAAPVARRTQSAHSGTTTAAAAVVGQQTTGHTRNSCGTVRVVNPRRSL